MSNTTVKQEDLFGEPAHFVPLSWPVLRSVAATKVAVFIKEKGTI